MAKAKPKAVTATDETTLPLEAQPEAPAPVVGGADISQAEGNAPAGNPIADEPVPVMDTAPQAPADPDTLPPVPSDAETTLPLEAQPEAPAPVVGGADISQPEGSAPAGNPIADEPVPVMDTAPQAPADPDTLPPVPSDAEIADPVVMPDATLLRALIAAIEARNTDLHRPALWAELERAGAVVESGRLVLAGVSAAGEGLRKGMLANWTNAARRKLMEMGNA